MASRSDVPVNIHDERFQWYAVITASGMEKKAREILLDLIKKKGKQDEFGAIVIPVKKVPDLDAHGMPKKDKNGMPKMKERKLMPGYILVQMHMTEENHNLVKNCPNIANFVNNVRKPGSQHTLPSPLSNLEVEKLLNPEQFQPAETAKPIKLSFSKGERVKVIDGPFTNFIGEVDEVRADKQRLRLLVSVFGRPTPVEIEFNKVEKIQE